MELPLLPFAALDPADNSTELEAIVIQGGVDKRASGAALLAQINRSGGVANIKDFGAKLDGIIAMGGINSGNATVTATTAVFTSTAVDAGKKVYIAGAGASGGPLLTSIVSVTDSTHAILANSAGTTVSNKVLIFGTDDREAWMDTINYCIYDSAAKTGLVVAPPGISIITDSILAGYGEFQHSIAVQGAGAGLTKVCALFHDRPAFSFQGLLNGFVAGLTLRGLSHEWIAGLGPATIDDTNLSNWVDPQMMADTTYCTYAGIAIDPVYSSMPGTHYPTVNYDTNYYPSPVQYGKLDSTNILIHDVEIDGFATGIVCQPCQASSAVHVDINRVAIRYSRWGLSFTGPNADNTADNLIFDHVGCCVVNNYHGSQSGAFSGVFSGWRLSLCIQVFQLNYCGGPVEISSLSGTLWTIGTVYDWSSPPNPLGSLVISNFVLNFTQPGSARGYPATVLSHVTFSQNPITHFVFRNGVIFNYVSSVAGFNISADNISFENVLIYTNNARSNSFEKFAHNALCGGIVTRACDALDRPRGKRQLKWRVWNLDTAAAVDTVPFIQKGNVMAYNTSRPFCIPNYVDYAGNSAGNRNSPYPTLPAVVTIGKTNATITNKTLTGIVLVLTMNQTAAGMLVGAPNAYGLSNGDVIIDDQTGTVWFVRSVTGSAGAYVVMADQQNNYKISSEGAVTNFQAISLTTGNWIFVNSRVYTTTYAMFGTTSSGSGAITAAGRSDGNNSWMTTDLVNGDYVLVDPQLDNWLASAVAGVLSAVAAGSFTVGSNANVSQVKKRLPFFVRPGPANSIGTLTLSGSFASPAVHGVTYDHTVKISGGIPTYNTPTVASGAIPTGTALSIVGATLRLYGTNPTAGHYTGTVTVKDSQASPATSNALAFDITIT